MCVCVCVCVFKHINIDTYAAAYTVFNFPQISFKKI